MALPKPGISLDPATNAARISAALDAIDANAAAIAGESQERASNFGSLQMLVQQLNANEVAARNAAIVAAVTAEGSERAANVFAEAQQRVIGDNSEAAARIAADILERNQRIAADAVEQAFRVAGDAALQAQVDDTKKKALPVSSRPGDGASAFTTSLAGGPAYLLPDLPDSLLAFGDNGHVARVIGTGLVAMRRHEAVELGRAYRARFVVQRRSTPSDPSNDAVECGIQWYDQTGNPTGGVTIVAQLTSLRSADGRKIVSLVYSRSSGAGIDVQPPAGARYAAAYVRTYGTDGLTDVEVVEIEDVTDEEILPAPTQDMLARLSALESGDFGARVSALEQDNQTPHARAYLTQSEAASDSPPTSSQIAQLFGSLAAGDSLGGQYMRVQALAEGAEGYTAADGSIWQRVNGSINDRDLSASLKAEVDAKLLVRNSREELASLGVGRARCVHCVRFHADGPVANVLYEIVDTPPTGRDAITSMSVPAQDASGHAVTRYTRIATRGPTWKQFGAYGDASPMSFTLNDSYYVTQKAKEHDDTAAIQASIDYLQDGDVWSSGADNAFYAVSSMLTFYRHRCVIDVGTLVPYGSYNDFLLLIAQGPLTGDAAAPGGSDPTMSNVSIMCTARRLRVCGRWQSRGVWFRDLYLSNMAGFWASHTYGTAWRMGDSYECSWFDPQFTLCKDRVSTDLSGAVAWANASIYEVGAIVKPNYATYDGAHTYGINDLVLYSGGVFRSLKSSNTGNPPTPNGPWWVRDEIEYYQAQIRNQGVYPLSASPNYTTAQDPPAPGAQDLRIWRRVFASEPLIDFTNAVSPTVVDHQYLIGGGIRDSSNLEFIRIDQAASGRPIIAIEGHGFHIEGLTPGITAATGNAIAVSDTAARANATYIRMSRSSRCKLIGCTIRVGGAGSTAIRLGGQHPLDVVSEIHIDQTDINGEDQFQIGIYTGVSVGTLAEARQAVGVVNIALADPTSLEVVDPAARLNNAGWVTQQRFADGTQGRPALAYRSEGTLGFYRKAVRTQALANGRLFLEATWQDPLQLAGAYLWFDGTNMRGKIGAPTSAADGSVLL
jgi:hypothetical protein